MASNCYDCGLEYGSDEWIEALVPDYIWNLIRPEGAEGSGGLLCISCICKRIKKLKINIKVPCFICGTEPITVLPNDDNNFMNFTLRNWDPDKGTMKCQ